MYLAPSVARSPDQIGPGTADDQPISRPSATPKPVAVQSAGRAVRDVNATDSPSPKPTSDLAGPIATSISPSPSQSPTARTPKPSPTGATAFDPQEKNSDDTPPDPVPSIRFGPVTEDALTVRWAPAHDDTAVVGYRVWLDGFAVATTPATTVTVAWFNDDMSQHVVQVKALDAAGNQSKSSESVLVARPTPEPTPEPTPGGAPTEPKNKRHIQPTPKPHTSGAPNGHG